MTYTIQQIADALDAQAVGDTSFAISRPAEPQSAGPDELAMAMSPKYAEALPKGHAQAAMLWAGADWETLGLKAAILVERPRRAMSGLTQMIDPGQGFGPGVHRSAVIDPDAQLGDNVSVGPLTVISAGARIGNGAVIGPQCCVGADVVLGDGAFLREGVSIGARVVIGDRFICQPGTRIGADGFSFVPPEPSGVEKARKTLGDQGDARAQSWMRIHSLGAVTIGDDVEIGANCTIDNGTIRSTEIGSGTKLDNLVHIGHNTRVGRDCLLCGQVGVSGSVEIGDNVVLGGQVGVSDNIFIGDGVIAAGGSKLLSNMPAGRVVMGYPAVKMDLNTDMYKALRRLPRALKDLAALKKAVPKSDESN
jgi:UDP-3-O-[3-hydroxymyristoyl] glucosamine N-acyltransferase